MLAMKTENNCEKIGKFFEDYKSFTMLLNFILKIEFS